MVLTPSVDFIKADNPDEYPFFYASHLPIAYYIAVGYLGLSAVLVRRLWAKIVLVMLLAVLVEATPVLMLENPWVPDQYIYSAEPVFLAQEHHISKFHYIDVTPALALTFSAALLGSNASPMILWQMAPLFGISAAFLVMLIGKRIGGNPAISGLLFVALNIWFQTNIFHRQIYSFVLFLLSILLLLFILERRRQGHSIAFIAVVFVVIIAHPGTSAFLIISLVVATLGLLFLGKNRTLSSLTMLTAVGFLAYNVYINLWDFPRMILFVSSAMNEIVTGGIGGAPGLGYLFGYTELFNSIMNVRAIIGMAYLGLATLVALPFLFKSKSNGLKFVSLLHFGFLVSFGAFMFGGAVYLLRPLLFLIPTSALLIAKLTTLRHESISDAFQSSRISVERLLGFLRSRTLCRIAKCVVIVCLLVLLILAPVFRYSGIPYLHPPSEELSGKLFLDRKWNYPNPIYVTERNLPYGYSLILEWEDPQGEPYTILEYELNPSLNNSFFLVHRYTTRDGYWIGNGTFSAYMDNLEESISVSHSLIYQSDEHHKIFLWKP